MSPWRNHNSRRPRDSQRPREATVPAASDLSAKLASMKQLLRIDAKYRALVEELSEMWTFYRQAEDARLECGPESEALSLRARMELERQGIQIPHARRPALRADAVVSPRDPTELVEIVTEFCGTFFAAEVVLLSFEIVEHTVHPTRGSSR
jgi:hypothetical protein